MYAEKFKTSPVDHNRISEHKSLPRAVRVEFYDQNAPTSAIASDLISYLGEYRAGIEVFHYSLKFTDGHLRSPHDKEPMIIKAKRSYDEAVYLNPEKIPRRLAELKHAEQEEKIVPRLQNGDWYVYFSPPDIETRDEGDYGFFYLAQIEDNTDGRVVNKQAIRINSTDISAYEDALMLLFSEASNPKETNSPEQIFYPPQSSHDLIPQIIVFPNHKDTEQNIFDVLYMSDLRYQHHTTKTERFYTILPILQPYIDEYVSLLKDPYISGEEKNKAFNALQNLCLELITDRAQSYSIQSVYEMNTQPPSLLTLPVNYHQEPPIALGSCGSSSDSGISLFSSASMHGFNSAGSTLKLTTESSFDCPRCHNPIPPKTETCPHCGLTKQEHIQQLEERGEAVCK